MINKTIPLLFIPILAFSLELCDTKINLNDPVKQKWGMQNEKVFNIYLQTYNFKTLEEICKVYVDSESGKIVKLQKRNSLPSVASSYPNIFQNMHFDFGEIEYKDNDQPKQYLKTQSFQDFSDTNLKFIDVIIRSKAVYRNENNGDISWIETVCDDKLISQNNDNDKNCITTFTLYSGEFLNKDKVKNKLFKDNVEKESKVNGKSFTEKN